ncbi:MAG: hypothetical protein ACI9DC_003562 [Gammaproteobacteria bacterium]|jgi:hypothetical protein
MRVGVTTVDPSRVTAVVAQSIMPLGKGLDSIFIHEELSIGVIHDPCEPNSRTELVQADNRLISLVSD